MSILFWLITFFSNAEAPACWGQIELSGVINAGSLDYIERSFKSFEGSNCQSILININTPGGSLDTTRRIVEKILSSKIPVLCLVSPSGGHAGSAGAIILQACHLAGALRATNLGAATPIMGSGQDIVGDLKNKMIEDTKSWVVGLAKLRSRNIEFAEEIITKAKSLDADEAFKIKAIDFVGISEEEFIHFATSKPLAVNSELTVTLTPGPIKKFPFDFRSQLLQFVGNPEIAYIIFMGSIALLYFEVTHAGVILPGVLGGLGLILSLMSFHMLQVSWGGVALIGFGAILFLLEIFITSFGILGIGGAVALLLGSMFLFEKGDIAYLVPWKTVIPVVFGLTAIILAISWLAAKTLKLKRTLTQSVWVDKYAEVTSLNSNLTDGQCIIQGEIWKCRAQGGLLQINKKYKVIEEAGLTLILKVKE